MNSDEMSSEDVLKVARDAFIKRKLSDVIVASTRGETGLAAARIFKGANANLVVVGHSVGFKEPNLNSFSQDARREIEALGGKVLQSTMPFHSINDAIRVKSGTSIETLIADTLRMLGQGTKVCVEIVSMACDNGLLESGRNVLSIAGTGQGADTVLVLRSANSKRLFDIRVIEIIVKPEKI